MAGNVMDRTSPWWTERAPAERRRSPRTDSVTRRRIVDRREARRLLLRSARMTLEEAELLVAGIAVSPARSTRLAVTRARIAATLFELERLQATIGGAMQPADAERADVGVIRLLADQIDELAAWTQMIARGK